MVLMVPLAIIRGFCKTSIETLGDIFLHVYSLDPTSYSNSWLSSDFLLIWSSYALSPLLSLTLGWYEPHLSWLMIALPRNDLLVQVSFHSWSCRGDRERYSHFGSWTAATLSPYFEKSLAILAATFFVHHSKFANEPRFFVFLWSCFLGRIVITSQTSSQNWVASALPFSLWCSEKPLYWLTSFEFDSSIVSQYFSFSTMPSSAGGWSLLWK